MLHTKCKNFKHGLAAETEREELPQKEVCNSPSCIDDKNAETAEMSVRLNKELRS